jgi:hypothetical protein
VPNGLGIPEREVKLQVVAMSDEATACPAALELVNTRRIMAKVTHDVARFLAEPFSAGEETVDETPVG